jgi:hypothetical protein
MGKRKSASAVVCIIVLLAAAVSLYGQSANRTTFVTVSGPVALPGVTLGAGTYVFEVIDPITNNDIVTVLNKDRSKVYYSGFTRRVDRPTGQVGAVSIEEAPPGAAPRILAWYPIGLSTGHGFIYPKARR